MINVIEDIQSGNLPKILFKYRTFTSEFDLNVLRNSEVYFSSPKKFEDPKDCKLDYTYKSLTKENIWKRGFQIITNENPTFNRATKRGQLRQLEKVSPIYNPHLRPKIENKFRNQFEEMAGVLSLSTEFDNSDMWKKYANDFSGFCVGFNSEFFFNKDIGAIWGKVIYTEHLPKICPIILPEEDVTKNWLTELFYKENKWDFENEYRVIGIRFNGIEDQTRKKVLGHKAIEVIYLGRNILKSNSDLVFKICEKNQIDSTRIIFL